jgi:hypothetical protein
VRRNKRRAPCPGTPLGVLAMKLVRGVSVRREDLDARYAKGCPSVGIRHFGRFLDGRGRTSGVGERRHGTADFLPPYLLAGLKEIMSRHTAGVGLFT